MKVSTGGWHNWVYILGRWITKNRGKHLEDWSSSLMGETVKNCANNGWENEDGDWELGHRLEAERIKAEMMSRFLVS